MLNNSWHLGEYQKGSEKDKNRIGVSVVLLGADVVVVFGGGDSHIGSLAHSKKSIGKQDYQFTFPEHMDNYVVDLFVEGLKDQVKGEILVVGGIHYNEITKEQISEIMRHCSDIVEDIRSDLSSGKLSSSK